MAPNFKIFYSGVPNKRAGPNKRALCRVENVSKLNKRAGPNKRAGWENTES